MKRRITRTVAVLAVIECFVIFTARLVVTGQTVVLGWPLRLSVILASFLPVPAAAMPVLLLVAPVAACLYASSDGDASPTPGILFALIAGQLLLMWPAGGSPGQKLMASAVILVVCLSMLLRRMPTRRWPLSPDRDNSIWFAALVAVLLASALKWNWGERYALVVLSCVVAPRLLDSFPRRIRWTVVAGDDEDDLTEGVADQAEENPADVLKAKLEELNKEKAGLESQLAQRQNAKNEVENELERVNHIIAFRTERGEPAVDFADALARLSAEDQRLSNEINAVGGAEMAALLERIAETQAGLTSLEGMQRLRAQRML